MRSLENAYWKCLHAGCGAGGEGTQAEMDKGAAKHAESKAGPRHPTVTGLGTRSGT